MKIKKKIQALKFTAIALSISVLTCGFSSFVMENDISSLSETEIIYSVGDIISSNNYVTLSSNEGYSDSGIEMFKFNSKGFVVNETVGYECNIVYYLKFNTYAFFQDFHKTNVAFKNTLRYKNEFTTSFGLLTSNYFSATNSNVQFAEGNFANENMELLEMSSSCDDNNKNISINFDYTFNSENLINKMYTWIKISYYFILESNSYANLYSNEFALVNNQAVYVLNVEVS